MKGQLEKDRSVTGESESDVRLKLLIMIKEKIDANPAWKEVRNTEVLENLHYKTMMVTNSEDVNNGKYVVGDVEVAK